MLHAKYERSSPYGLGQEDFLKVFTLLPWQPEFFTEFNSLKYFERGSRIISVKFDWNLIVSLGEEDFFVIVNGQTNGQTDGRQTNHNSSPWALRAQVS